MLIRIELGRHLLERMDVVPEIPQPVAELLHVLADQAQITSDVDEIIERPLLKLLHLAQLVLRTES